MHYGEVHGTRVKCIAVNNNAVHFEIVSHAVKGFNANYEITFPQSIVNIASHKHCSSIENIEFLYTFEGKLYVTVDRTGDHSPS